MKNTYQKILVTAITVLLAAPFVCVGGEKEQQDFWSEDNPKAGYKAFQPSHENPEDTMAWLKKACPEKAQELRRLREQNPERFEAKIREMKHRRYESKYKGQKDHRGFPYGPHKQGFGPAAGYDRKPSAERMREKHSEYIKWLGKNYPEKAEKMAELKEKNPRLYFKHLKMGHRKHRKIMEAEEENPRLAEVLKQDMELKGKRDKLFKAIRKAGDDKEKEKLTRQLKEVISSRFDLIVKRKQIAYEQLQKKLEALKKRVEESQIETQKWNKLKDEKVSQRLEELLTKTETFNWD